MYLSVRLRYAPRCWDVDDAILFFLFSRGFAFVNVFFKTHHCTGHPARPLEKDKKKKKKRTPEAPSPLSSRCFGVSNEAQCDDCRLTTPTPTRTTRNQCCFSFLGPEESPLLALPFDRYNLIEVTWVRVLGGGRCEKRECGMRADWDLCLPLFDPTHRSPV